MKKLMVALAAVALAAGAQAAYVSWTISAVKDAAGTSLAAGSQYAFFFTSSTDASDAIAAINALAGKGATAVQTYMDGADFTDIKRATAAGGFSVGTSSANGGYSTASGASPALPTNAGLGLDDNKTYYMFSVIFDTATITDASKFYVANGAPTTTGAATKDGTNIATFNLGSQSSKSTVDGAWKAVGAVPEPTSAMLLLLGVAGLALRRRRA